MILGILIGSIMFLVLTVVAAFPQSVVLWGIALLVVGTVFIRYKNRSASPTAVFVMGSYAVIWGSLTLALPFFCEGLEMRLFLAGFGGMFLGIGIYQGIAKPLLCREQITAIYMGARPCRGGRYGWTYYDPIFAYRYENYSYQNTTGEVYSRRKLLKKYKEGSDYPIYLNPRNPGSIRTKRMPQKTDVLLICIGLLCVSVALAEVL